VPPARHAHLDQSSECWRSSEGCLIVYAFTQMSGVAHNEDAIKVVN
jgi:hypothetical protein